MKSRTLIARPKSALKPISTRLLSYGKAALAQTVAPFVVWAGLIVWALAHPSIRTPSAPPPDSALVLGGVTFATAIIVRQCRDRFSLGKSATYALPDPLYTLYLATVILSGTPNAVIFAAIAPFVEYAPDLLRHPARLSATLWHAAIAALTTLLAGITYVTIWPALSSALTELRAHSLGALAASVVMFFGAACISGFEQDQRDHVSVQFIPMLRRYLTSPAARFQVLLLCMAPLLPLANLLDVVEAEFAWILLLVPLGAVYYLALASVRLQQRSDELQTTVRQLETARRRQAELTDYAVLITRAQEDERLRLARELHDDTAQALIALSRGLDALAARPVEPPLSDVDARFINELGSLSKRTLDSVRRACQDLRPSVLDDLGLSAALESLAHSMTERGLTCTVLTEGEEQPCAPEVEVTIYRIAQEALSNALRHAHATQTTLEISYQPERIILRVSDDGCGFDPERIERLNSEDTEGEREPRSGLGLLGMRERATLIGARLEIHSAPQHGTTAVLQAPLHR